MNQVLHHLGKDLRHFRAALALWLFVVAGQTVLVGLGPRLSQNSLIDEVLGLLSILRPILACVLVALAVGDEPLVGRTAFWLTRPIRRRALFGEKFWFIGLFLVLPAVVAEVALMAANHVTARDIALGAAENIFTHFAWLLPVAVLASFTPSFTRFALLVLAIVAGIVVLLFSIMFLSSLWSEEPDVYAEPPPLANSTPLVVLYVLMIGMSLAVLGHQYATRRLRRSAGLALAGAAVAVLTPGFWPWSFLKQAEPGLAGFDPGSLRLVADTGTTWIGDAYFVQRKRRAEKNIACRLELVGLPPEYTANPVEIHPRLTFPDGRTVERARTSTVSVPRQADEREPRSLTALRRALGDPRLFAGERFGREAWPVLITLDDELFSKYGKQPAPYAADFVFQLNRYDVRFELPLEPGATFSSGSHRVVVTDVFRQSEGCVVELRESFVTLLFDPQPQAGLYGGYSAYAFVNRKRQEAVLTDGFSLPVGASFLGTSMTGPEPGRITIRRVQVRPEAPERSRPDAPRLDAAWLADATLVRLESPYAGRVPASLRIEGLRLDTR